MNTTASGANQISSP